MKWFKKLFNGNDRLSKLTLGEIKIIEFLTLKCMEDVRNFYVIPSYDWDDVKIQFELRHNGAIYRIGEYGISVTGVIIKDRNDLYEFLIERYKELQYVNKMRMIEETIKTI